MRRAHHRAIEHRLECADGLLDFRRSDVLTAPDHELLEASGNGQESVRVAAGEVACVVPPVAQRRCRFRRLAMVALHHVGTPHDELALLTKFDIRATTGIDQAHGKARYGEAAGSHDPTAFEPVHRHHGRGLSDPVAVEQLDAEALLELLVDGRGHDGARRNARAQSGEHAIRRAARGLEQVMEHRRHAREEREPAGLQQAHDFRGGEFFENVLARADRKDAQDRQIERIRMEQRKRRQHAVVFRQAGNRRPARRRHPKHSTLCQQHALGTPRGARGVNDK